MRETIFEMLRAALSDAAFDNIYIFTHGNPDGDAVGSASAMAKLLRSYGKRASVFFSEVNTPSPKLSYLECIYKNEYDFTPEHIITVDLTDMNRISGVPLCFSDLRELEKRIDFVIDHHEVNTIDCPNKLVIPSKGACGEIIYDLYKYLGRDFDEESASALYTAILTDTGAFRYSNTTPSAHIAASELLPFISKPLRQRIISLNFETKPKQKMMIEAEAVREAVFFENDTLAFSVFDKERRERLGARDSDLDFVSSLLRQIEGVRAAFMLRQEPDGRYKVSVRTDHDGETGMDASAISAEFGGGGHKAAAGFTAAMDKDELIARLVEICKK